MRSKQLHGSYQLLKSLGLALKTSLSEIYSNATIFRMVTLLQMLFVIPKC
jgi:hypothetical protein